MNLLETTDWLVIALYFVIIAAIAIWSIMKRNNSAKDYFLAGKNLGWFVIGSSIFASNIGSEHLVGLAGSGATDGVAMAHYELQAWCLIILAWVLMPFYLRSKVFTMPEFLERRFSGRARTVLSAISLIAYILTKLAVGVYAGGMVFNALIPEMSFMGLDSFWIGSILIIVLTGIYTALGGMKAVAYTEAFQTVILIIGASLVTILGLQAIGGWGELKATVGDEMFNLWKPIVPEGVENTWKPVKETAKMAWYFNDNYPWIGMLFCAPIIGLWYWTTDQYIVQRVLGAANETQARRGAIAAAFFKLFPVFIFIIPGIISYALAISGKMPILGQELLDANGEIIRDQAQQAFPLMVMHVLPVGVRGLVVAGLFAALMSSLAGAFNASSTLFTIDFYSKLKPNVSQKELVFMGRMATVVMIVIGLLWIPVIRGGKGLYDYLQGIQAYLAPPIAVVFFAGIFHKRLNAKGCLAALYVGFLLGIFRLVVDTPIKLIDDFSYTEGSFLWIINNMFFQYYSMVIFIISLIVMFVVSYMSEQPSYEQIKGLTFGTVSAEDKAATRRSWNKWDVIISSLVILIIVAIYIYFS
ncbi:MAG TPA: sodium:solute symporter [Candidatus Sphingobacterium stercoripullorum]|nr:sodium:solute symporter [Candidatus Sphingobacterium stercoripullorum]